MNCGIDKLVTASNFFVRRYCLCLRDWVVRGQEVFCECCIALHKSIKWQWITKSSSRLFASLHRWVKAAVQSYSILTFFYQQSRSWCHTWNATCTYLEMKFIKVKICVILFCCQTAEVRWWATIKQEASLFSSKLEDANNTKRVLKKMEKLFSKVNSDIHVHASQKRWSNTTDSNRIISNVFSRL